MSPASKSKSKDKKVSKETAKASSNANASGHKYNTLSGTFHTFDTNGRFRSIDDSDDRNGNSSGTGAEYDSVSNNGSWSGESEDPPKEKASQPRQESVPGADNDKREKIRQKNERKHQRQKERRAQELHERCSVYLMSRKLEALAQQLVSMGFSHERATMALILNEGRVEESIAWLFEVAEDEKQVGNDSSGGNLKIDISEELAQMRDMEIRYKASKQEVERAVVSCEGDLPKAEEILKAQKQEPPKPEETGDPIPPTAATSGGRMPPAAAAALGQNATRGKSSTPFEATPQQRDFNYTKVVAATAGPGPISDPGTRTTHMLLQKTPSTWAKPPVEKSLGPNNSSNPSSDSSRSLAASLLRDRYLTVNNELKNMQLGSMREPVIMSITPKQQPAISSSPPSNWYPNSTTTSVVDTMKSSKVAAPTAALCRSISPKRISSNPPYNQAHHHPHHQQSGRNPMDLHGPTARVNGGGRCLSAASSLGLFSGLNTGVSSGPSSPVDWSTGGSSLQLDYTSIDWSLDLGTLPPPRPNGVWVGGSYSLQNDSRRFGPLTYGPGVKSAAMRPLSGWSGLPEGVAASGEGGGGGGSREWTSAFEGRDIFSLSRQFVSSPSL